MDAHGRLAQSVERGANNAKVVGSRPTLAMSFRLSIFITARLLQKCFAKI